MMSVLAHSLLRAGDLSLQLAEEFKVAPSVSAGLPRIGRAALEPGKNLSGGSVPMCFQRCLNDLGIGQTTRASTPADAVVGVKDHPRRRVVHRDAGADRQGMPGSTAPADRMTVGRRFEQLFD